MKPKAGQFWIENIIFFSSFKSAKDNGISDLKNVESSFKEKWHIGTRCG